MEKENFSTEQSLQLITQMIEQTKKNLNRNSFNSWIGWGVFTTILGLLIYFVVKFTGVNQWNYLWFLEFAYAIYDGKRNERKEGSVISHIDSAIEGIWKALGWLYILTPVLMTFAAIYLHQYYAFNMIMPLVLIYTIVGVTFTGVLLREKWIVFIPIAGSLSPLYMFATISSQRYEDWYMLMFVITFFVVMVIPGIILNHKSKR